jgi:peptide/nickel transport system substrate-binding protein
LAADLPFALAGAAGSIISPAALDNPDLDVNPVGSGPYVLSELRGGDSITYERREGYWDEGAQQAAVLQVRGIGDGNARVNALRSGQVDMIRYATQDSPQISNLGPGFTDYSYPAAGPISVWLNSSRPHLSDGRVRQALNWAIDRDAINEALMAGECSPSAQPLPEVYSGHLEEPPISYGYDPDKARELLRVAGVSDGLSFKLLTLPHSPWGNLATAVQEQLGEVGVDVQVEQLEPARAVPTFMSGGYDGFLAARSGSPTGAMVLADNYLTRYPGPLPDGFEEAVIKAFDPRLDEAAQVDATEDASAIGNEFALDVFICGDSSNFASSDKVIGEEDMGVAAMFGFADFRYVGLTQ